MQVIKKLEVVFRKPLISSGLDGLVRLVFNAEIMGIVFISPTNVSMWVKYDSTETRYTWRKFHVYGKEGTIPDHWKFMSLFKTDNGETIFLFEDSLWRPIALPSLQEKEPQVITSSPRYSHACSIAFSVESNDPEGKDLTPTMLKNAIHRRMEDLNRAPNGDHEWIEAVGLPDESVRVEK